MTSVTGAAGWGWRIHVGLSALLVLNGLGLFLFIVDTHTERTIGLLLTAFAAFGFAVAMEGLRNGSAWCWRTSWILVASLVALGAHSLRAERTDLPVLYLGLGALGLVAQLLARPTPTVVRP